MKTANRNPREFVGREEREVRRQFSALRRVQQKPFGVVDVPDHRRPSMFEAALVEATELHRELLWRRLGAQRLALSLAAERMRDGTYGLCEDCGCRIPLRRLRALPTATKCIRCQERQEAAAA